MRKLIQPVAAGCARQASCKWKYGAAGFKTPAYCSSAVSFAPLLRRRQSPVDVCASLHQRAQFKFWMKSWCQFTGDFLRELKPVVVRPQAAPAVAPWMAVACWGVTLRRYHTSRAGGTAGRPDLDISGNWFSPALRKVQSRLGCPYDVDMLRQQLSTTVKT
jgi:hypothetical protein